MVSPNTKAQQVLHFTAAFATIIYWAGAVSAAACLLHKPSKKSTVAWRRWALFVGQILVFLTFAAEGVAIIIRQARTEGWSPAQDYGVYLITSTAVHLVLALNLYGKALPILHPFLGAWLLSLAYEVTLLSLQATQHSKVRSLRRTSLGLNAARSALLLVLALVSATCMLKDRSRSIRLDDESEALLANGDANGTANGTSSAPKPVPRLFPDDDEGVSTKPGGDADDEMDFDSECDDPDEAKEMRAKQKERLEKSGSWLGYFYEFRIFVPMIVPSSKDRLAQICLGAMVLLTLAERALHILAPRQIGIIINKLTFNAGTGIVPWIDIGMYAIYLILGSRAGLPSISYMCRLPVDAYARKAIVTGAFNHIMGLSMDFHNGKDSGELIRAIEQGTALQDMVLMLFFDIIPVFLDLAFACVYVWLLFDVYVALIPIGFGVVFVWTGAKSTSWSINLRRALVTTERYGSKIQNEAITNWRTVSHFNRAKYEEDRYDEAIGKYNIAERWYYFIFYLVGGAQALILTTAELLVIILAIRRVAQGLTPVGSLVTLLQYWGMVEYPLNELSWSVRRITSMLTDSERLLQLFLTKPTVVDAADATDINVTAGEVEFKNCAFSYDPRNPILKDISFTVPAGATVALVGETGGGKSTILKLLYRYYDLNSGSITIDGQDIRTVTLDSLRDVFGMVPQDPSLFNAPIIDNIRYARLDATDEEVHAACRAAAIHEKILSFPDGYASKVGERGVKLSGGEMQRVAIARAILRQPKIVLLDEATSMIDAETEVRIQEAFQGLAQGRTTFVIAHRLSTIQHADLILVIQNGQIVERGSHGELFGKKGAYWKLWSKQFNKDVLEAGAVLNKDEGSAEVSLIDVQEESSDKKDTNAQT